MPTIFYQITDIKNLEKAYKKALSGKSRYSPDALKFQKEESLNLFALQERLKSKTYNFSGYYKFSVFEPKERIVHAPYFVDKVTQLAMHFILVPIFMKGFINESYSCLPNRGAHKAVDRVQKNLRAAINKWEDKAYIAKIDIKKFFYSIDRKILKNIYRKTIKDPDVLWIMDLVTDSANVIDVTGVPLGNTMSQLYSNIFLNELDQYCKRYLGYKYYARYADDIIIILPGKQEAQKAKKLCIKFLKEKLNLETNKSKTQIFPIKNGVNAFGFKIRVNYRLLRNDSKKKIKKKIKAMPRLIKSGRMRESKANQMVASWQGHAKHGNSKNFIENLLKRFPYIYLDTKGILRIDITKFE